MSKIVVKNNFTILSTFNTNNNILNYYMVIIRMLLNSYIVSLNIKVTVIYLPLL